MTLVILKTSVASHACQFQSQFVETPENAYFHEGNRCLYNMVRNSVLKHVPQLDFSGMRAIKKYVNTPIILIV